MDYGELWENSLERTKYVWIGQPYHETALKRDVQAHAWSSILLTVHRNIKQIVLLVIPGVGPGYRGAGPWPGVGVPQQRRASVAAVARPWWSGEVAPLPVRARVLADIRRGPSQLRCPHNGSALTQLYIGQPPGLPYRQSSSPRVTERTCRLLRSTASSLWSVTVC